MDPSGSYDLTAETAHIFTHSMPAAWESDPAAATHWTVEVHDLEGELVD